LTHRFTLILTIAILITGCAPAARKPVQLPEVVTVAPTPVLPPVQAPPQVIQAEILSVLPPAPPVPDGVTLALAEARLHFDRGTGLYDTGFLKQARGEFDAAIDSLLDEAAMDLRIRTASTPPSTT
jgi:hypothetical protein